jgi:hypothetical protein
MENKNKLPKNFLVAPKKRNACNSAYTYICKFKLVMCFLQFKSAWRNGVPPTIGDRQFVSFVQFYLHKCGDITLDQLEIRESTGRDWRRPSFAKKFEYARPLTDVSLPMPENIKNFREICLEFVFIKNNFLHKIS